MTFKEVACAVGYFGIKRANTYYCIKSQIRIFRHFIILKDKFFFSNITPNKSQISIGQA